jgi:hypothetical protein
MSGLSSFDSRLSITCCVLHRVATILLELHATVGRHENFEGCLRSSKQLAVREGSPTLFLNGANLGARGGRPEGVRSFLNGATRGRQISQLTSAQRVSPVAADCLTREPKT